MEIIGRQKPKKLAILHDYFKKLEEKNKPLTKFKNEHYFPKGKGKIPSDEEIAKTNKFLKELGLKTGKDLTMAYCKSDAILIADTCLKLHNVSIETFGLDPFYCVSLPSLIYDCDLYESRRYTEYFRHEEVYLLNESSFRGGVSGVHRPRYFKSAGERWCCQYFLWINYDTKISRHRNFV